MNIEDLTKILTLLGGISGNETKATDDSKPLLASSFIGKFVICRSRNEGINAGTVVELDDTGVVLKDVRRIWYHKPKDVNKSWYEGVALSGLSDDSKVSCTVEFKAIIEDYSLTACSEESKNSIISKVPNAQN